MEQDLLRGNNIMLPEFDFQEKKRTGFTLLNAPKSGVVGQACNFALSYMLKQGQESY
jgi:hypothetical protein